MLRSNQVPDKAELRTGRVERGQKKVRYIYRHEVQEIARNGAPLKP